MGHGAVVVSSRCEQQQQKQPQVLRLRSGRQVCNLGFEVSHPFRDETAKWMGHGAELVSSRCKKQHSKNPWDTALAFAEAEGFPGAVGGPAAVDGAGVAVEIGRASCRG